MYPDTVLELHKQSYLIDDNNNSSYKHVCLGFLFLNGKRKRNMSAIRHSFGLPRIAVKLNMAPTALYCTSSSS